jgi:AcrR family transcriptional regulator
VHVQKNKREQEILSIARIHLLEQPFETIKMAAIAKNLSFSRENLYKYFQRKEEVYLTLLAEECLTFTESLHHRLENEKPEKTLEHFIAHWSSNLARVLFGLWTPSAPKPTHQVQLTWEGEVLIQGLYSVMLSV